MFATQTNIQAAKYIYMFWNYLSQSKEMLASIFQREWSIYMVIGWQVYH